MALDSSPPRPLLRADRAPLLVLIGFMGAGKSTLGSRLAQELACPLFDLDDEIARAHGAIPELFASRGESGFRAIEHHQLNQLLPTLPRPAVLALGGGAFLQPANRHLLDQHSATTIFFDAPFDVLYDRIRRGSAHERPLAADPEKLGQLYLQRRPTYLLAQHTLDVSSDDPAAVLSSLLQLTHRLGVAAPAKVKL